MGFEVKAENSAVFLYNFNELSTNEIHKNTFIHKCIKNTDYSGVFLMKTYETVETETLLQEIKYISKWKKKCYSLWMEGLPVRCRHSPHSFVTCAIPRWTPCHLSKDTDTLTAKFVCDYKRNRTAKAVFEKEQPCWVNGSVDKLLTKHVWGPEFKLSAPT